MPGQSSKRTLTISFPEYVALRIPPNRQVSYCEEENVEIKRVNKLLTVQRNEALSQYDQLIIEKQCMQTEMYSKFVEVLNEKKKKLRQYKGIFSDQARSLIYRKRKKPCTSAAVS